MITSTSKATDTLTMSVKRTRYVREDGKVGVVISPGFGGGFSTWANDPEMALDPLIVELVLALDPHEEGSVEYNAIQDKIYHYVTGEKYNASYHGDKLIVAWVPQGVRFIIHEYDGSESIWREDEIRWIKA